MKSPLDFHQGATLHRVAKTYKTVLEALLEMIQNALDTGATNIQITVNQVEHNLAVRDNGDGATQAKFEKALQSVGHSIKRSDQLGRFGLGLVSFVGKCKRYSFTSTPKGDDRGYREWTFDSGEIEKQERVFIPLRTRPDLVFEKNERGATTVTWRTEISVHSYTTDRFISRLSPTELAAAILDKFSPAMRRHDTGIHLKFKDEKGANHHLDLRAKEFEGTPLPEVELKSEESGKTIFRLFLAKREHSKGRKQKARVLLGERRNDFRIPFGTFAVSLPGGLRLTQEVNEALDSGVFEGEILSEKAVLEANRRGFEPNDALFGLVCTIEEWYKEHGAAHYKEVTNERRAKRYQDLGLRSLRVIEALTRMPRGKFILDVIKTFRFGNRGQEHFDVPGLPGGIHALSTQGGHDESPGKTTGDRKPRPKTEHKEHVPMVSAGPAGQKRRFVRNGSFGLVLEHEVLQGTELWKLDCDHGVLCLNIRHHLWRECEDDSERTLGRFQEFLMLQALSLQLVPEEWREQARMAVEEQNAPYVFMLIQGDRLSGRALGGRTRETAEALRNIKSLQVKQAK